jgi:hypothetical protein
MELGVIAELGLPPIPVRLSFSAYRCRRSYHEIFLDLFVGHCLRQAEASVKFAEQLSSPPPLPNGRSKMGDGAPAAEPVHARSGGHSALN